MPSPRKPVAAAPQGVQSVDTGLAVALVVARASGALSLKDIASKLGMLPSTAHRHLVSLSRAGFIEQVGPSGRYDLGPQAAEFGLAALRRLDVQKLWGHAIEQLRDRTEMTSMVIVWGNVGPTVVQWKESPQAVWVNAHVGTVLPLTRSAAGLVFCAHLPSREVDEKIRAELQSSVVPTHLSQRVTASSLKVLTAEVRACGYAAIDGDLIPGVAALSAPVFDGSGRVTLALSLLGTSSMLDLDPRGRHVAALMDVARELSARQGHAVAAA